MTKIGFIASNLTDVSFFSVKDASRGFQDPGKLDVVEEGAYTDLLLTNSEPFKDISILTRPAENLALMMKISKIIYECDKTRRLDNEHI